MAPTTLPTTMDVCRRVLIAGALATAATAARASPPDSTQHAQCSAGVVLHNDSGCTAAGHYAETNATSTQECCQDCASSAGGECVAWTFHQPRTCYLGSVGKVHPDVKGATCGCRFAECKGGHPPSPSPRPPSPSPPSPSPPSPPNPPGPKECVPVVRPPTPARVPLPPGKTQPHLVSLLVSARFRVLAVVVMRAFVSARAAVVSACACVRVCVPRVCLECALSVCVP